MNRYLIIASIFALSSPAAADDFDRCVEVLDGSHGLIATVLFDFGSSASTAPTRATMEALTKVIATKELVDRVFVVGFADQVGSDRSNYLLSLERAAEVKSYFLTPMPERTEVEAVGCGETSPLIDQPPGVRHPHNRRVEIRWSSN